MCPNSEAEYDDEAPSFRICPRCLQTRMAWDFGVGREPEVCDYCVSDADAQQAAEAIAAKRAAGRKRSTWNPGTE